MWKLVNKDWKYIADSTEKVEIKNKEPSIDDQPILTDVKPKKASRKSKAKPKASV